MGYRLPPHPDDRVHYDAMATESTISVDNGTITRVAIPCFYSHGHIIARHYMMCVDHAGWPSPDHPDTSWQTYGIPDDSIHLEDEGYTDVEMIFASDVPDGIVVTGSLDDNIIRLVIEVECQDALTEDVDASFSLHIVGEQLNNTVTKGILHIAAGPLG